MPEYKLVITLKARKEIEYFFEYYKSISEEVYEEFIFDIDIAYNSLIKIPKLYRKRYLDYRRINFHKFPIMFVYLIVENTNTVKLMACYHQSSEPKKFYK